MHALKNEKLVWLLLLLFTFTTALAFKAWLVFGDFIPFNADEAIVALMARHILQGARPVFFYGQAYMGSLDAYLVAGAFSIFGENVEVIRLVQSLLYICVIATTVWLGKLVFNSWKIGGLAALIMALPTVNVTLYTTVSLGGYGEALLIGNLVLIVALLINRSLTSNSDALLLWFILGFLSGLGLWSFGLTIVYTLPAVLYTGYYLSRKYVKSRNTMDEESNTSDDKGFFRTVAVPLLILVLGGIFGSAPWWGYAIDQGIKQLLVELGGGAIAGVEGLPWVFQVGQHLVSFFVLGGTVIFGLRPPWGVHWLALPMLPFVLFFWMGVLIYMMRFLRQSSPYRGAAWLLTGVMLTLIAAFIFTPFGADPSGRYFLPLAIPLALFAASMITSLGNRFGGWAYALIALLLVFNLIGTLQSARQYPPGITTQFYAPAQVDHSSIEELEEFLHRRGETHGYTNYWVSYPLAFRSGESLIYVPGLPYHLDFRYTQRDNRYAPWV